MEATLTAKSERLEIRLSNSAKFLLQEAAQATHKTVSEFLLSAGISAANQTLADRLFFELGEEKWKEFQAALEHPVRSKPRLARLLNEPGVLD